MHNSVETEFVHFALLSQYFQQNIVVANEFFPSVEPSSPDYEKFVIMNIPLSLIHPMEE